jgi:hypothetical protein
MKKLPTTKEGKPLSKKKTYLECIGIGFSLTYREIKWTDNYNPILNLQYFIYVGNYDNPFTLTNKQIKKLIEL